MFRHRPLPKFLFDEDEQPPAAPTGPGAGSGIWPGSRGPESCARCCRSPLAPTWLAFSAGTWRGHRRKPFLYRPPRCRNRWRRMGAGCFPALMLTMNDVGRRRWAGGVDPRRLPVRSAANGRVDRASTLAAHALLDRPLASGSPSCWGMLIFGPALLEIALAGVATVAGAGHPPTYIQIFFSAGAILALG